MENSRDVYKDLVRQYNMLSDEEKRAIIIYKSKLYRIINLITSIDGFEYLSSDEIIKRLPNVEYLKRMVLQFKNILNRGENMVVRFSYFNNVRLDDFNLLIDYLRDIYFILERAKDKIILNDDLIVYRGIAVDDFYDVKDVAKGNLVSTSIKIEDTEQYMNFRNKAVLYMIKIKKGTPLLVTPTSLVCTYKDREDYLYKKLNGIPATTLKLINRGENGVEEVILFKDKLDFINEKREIREIAGKLISIHQVEAIPKLNKKKAK